MTTSLFVRHHHVEVEDGRLHRLEYQGSGFPLVCLHGVTGCAWGWHEVARELGDAVRLHAVDMRGHGDSSWSAAGEYSTAMHVEDLLAQIDSITTEQVDLAGSSWGALVAIEFAAAYPDRVRQLAVVDIEPSFEVSSRDVPPRPRAFANDGEVIAWLRANHPHAPAEALEAMAWGAFRAAAGGQLEPKHDPSLFEVWPFRDEDHWAALEAVRTRTLLLRADSTFVRAAVMEEMRERMADASLVQLTDTVHAISVDSPKQLATAFNDFFIRDTQTEKS